LRISIVGCGYVGLVTGSCLAQIGHEVLCIDNDEQKVRTLNAGKLPIYEPHLDVVVEKARGESRLRFTTDLPEAVHFGDAIFICVGTPPLESGDSDLSAVDRVARVIAAEAHSAKLVVEKSTVPVSTGEQLKKTLAVYRGKSQASFQVASNPEFLREGTAVEDFLHPDRIVVGVEDKGAEKQLREIYKPLLERTFPCPVHAAPCPPSDPVPFIVTTINSSELIKHASNSFLALKISYANALADLCEALGANIDEVTHAVGLDPRIGRAFLRPGIGFGGFCLPKDIQAFIRIAERARVDFSLLKEVERINKLRIPHFIEKARGLLWVLKGKQIGVLGLAFKAGTDDIRFAPAITLIEALLAEGAHVSAFDPQAAEKTRPLYPTVRFVESAYDAAQGADALIIATEWPEFKNLDWEKIRSSLARPLLLDGRNLLQPQLMKDLGFEYHSIGRPD
jgi:UDPglucose 6-dehydrogenase